MKKILLISMLLLSPKLLAEVESQDKLSDINDETICQELLEYSEETNSKTPLKIDDGTELMLTKVHCSGKIFSYSKRVLVHTSAFLDGWEDRKQLQHTQLHCNKIGLSRAIGWVVRDEIYNNDYTYAATLTTSPEDCK
jgi:hypothetical protein